MPIKTSGNRSIATSSPQPQRWSGTYRHPSRPGAIRPSYSLRRASAKAILRSRDSCQTLQRDRLRRFFCLRRDA